MIVVNTSYQAALWADALFAMDRQWWQTYRADIRARFRGERFSVNAIEGVQRRRLETCGNSGAGAIALAAAGGARRIVLLGYDGQYAADGKRHWHGDHPRHLGNAAQIGTWAAGFAKLAKALRHVEIINASRATALTCWPCQPLEEVLACP